MTTASPVDAIPPDNANAERTSLEETWPSVTDECVTCCECHRTLERRERYQRISGVWDGEARTFDTCTGCEKVRRSFHKHIGWKYNAPFGYLDECIKLEFPLGVPGNLQLRASTK